MFEPSLPRARGVAYAIVAGDEEIAYVAEDPDVLTRVVVLRPVAQLRRGQHTVDQAERVRSALRAEDWQEAILAWTEATGRCLDVLPDEPVWTGSGLDEERLRLELPLAPTFSDPGGR